MGRRGHLLPSQVAEIGQLAGESGLEGFEWRDLVPTLEPEKGPMGQRLLHKPTEFYVDFLKVPGKPDLHRLDFTPYQGATSGTRNNLRWDDAVRFVAVWLEEVEAEASVDSFESAFEKGRLSYLGGMSGDPEALFSADEVLGAESVLEEIEERIKNLENLREEDREFVRKELDELRAELRTMKRWKWMKLAMGTLMSLGLRLVLPEGFAQECMTDLMRVMQGIQNLLPPGE